MVTRPTIEDVMTMNAARCLHGKNLVSCRRTCKRSITLPGTEALTETLHAGAYRNQGAVHNVFIGGDMLEDAMPEVRERCAAGPPQ